MGWPEWSTDVARISVCNHVMLHAVLTRMQFCIWPHTWNDILDRYLLVNYFTSLLLLIKKTSCSLTHYLHALLSVQLAKRDGLEQIELRLLLLEFSVLTVESLLSKNQHTYSSYFWIKLFKKPYI